MQTIAKTLKIDPAIVSDALADLVTLSLFVAFAAAVITSVT
ncbi:hypothetical protein ABOZ73_06570 [Caulobacter sp. 73W]|jgi:hypothetical protein|uniref:Uncharacterized protein n=1 Tax=Caulobacter sp. 73W TaxID=3161137 RepID=A0AB39KXT2_9CAUL